jgi:hypothetical protein
MRYDIRHRKTRLREIVILAGIYFAIIALTRGLEPVLLLIAPVSALLVEVLDRIGLARTNYVILHEKTYRFPARRRTYGRWLVENPCALRSD